MSERESKGRLQRPLLVLAVLFSCAAGLALWPLAEPAPEGPPPPESGPAKVSRALPPPELAALPDAGFPLPPAPVIAIDAGTRPSPAPLAAGFCAPNGGSETFTVRFTLRRLLGESNRRPGLLAPEARALLQEALAAEARADAAEQLGALRRLRALLPADPAVAWALAQAQRDAPDLDEQSAALATYLAAEPTPGIARMRARLEVQREIQRDFRRSAREGVTLLWPAEALSEAQAEDLLREIAQDLDGAARLTRTQRRRALTVVVYPGRAELLAVSCVQSWAGGLYDGTLRLVALPEQRAGVDLSTVRHESLHAQVGPLAPRAPKWFHEGLAQSFAEEVPRVRGAWQLMVRNHSWIPFSSLDESFQVFEDGDDARLVYAQSLALVELLRDAGGEAAIAEALRAFEEGLGTPAALARATGRREVTGEDLLAFLQQRLAANR